MKVRMFYRTL